MGKYVYLNKEIDKEILIDWYINSTGEDTIWTEKHIDELLEDFVLVPKSSLKAIEEKTINDIKKQSVKRGRWIDIYEYCEKNGYIPSGIGIYYWCSECEKAEPKISDYCPNCGTRMDGDAE